MFLQPEQEADGWGPARTPGEADEATGLLSPPDTGPPTQVDSAPAPSPDEIVCPRCSQPNPLTRIRCERCGQELRVREVSAVTEPPPQPPATRSSGHLWLIVIGLLAVVGVGLSVFLIAREPGPGANGTPANAPIRVDPNRVRATASSSVLNDPTYDVTKTLDGDGATAWNSDGARLPSNVGVRLSYRFVNPVRLTRITVVNGYARTPTDYHNNQRVARFTVLTATATQSWALRDTADPQSLDQDFGSVAAVTFVVEAVYPGTKFKDLAVTEVGFYERP
jgi:hypothetical protein